jgi:hypothetical protein
MAIVVVLIFDPSWRPQSDAIAGVQPRRRNTMKTYHGSCHCGRVAFEGVRIAALDDLPVADLICAPVTYCDGLNDNWWNAPEETSHL